MLLSDLFCSLLEYFSGRTVLWKLTAGISRKDTAGSVTGSSIEGLDRLPHSPAALLLHGASALFLPRRWLPSSLLPPLRLVSNYAVPLFRLTLSLSIPLSLSLSVPATSATCLLELPQPTLFISHTPPLAPRSLFLLRQP